MKKSTKRGLIILGVIILLITYVGVTVSVDLKNNNAIVKIPRDKPESGEGRGSVGDVLGQIIRDGEYTSSMIRTIDYLNGRHDCADFRLPVAMHLLYEFPDKLTNEDLTDLKQAVLNFKYWMEDPGYDSMCHWSENHQILFATGEYLAGQLYPDTVFTNTGEKGSWHKERGKSRVLAWLEQRWNHGYIEWNSNTYYKEDIAPLAALIEFSGDDEVLIKAQMVMDLMMYDMASQSFKGAFVSTSGRSYETKKMAGHQSSMKRYTEILSGYDVDSNFPEDIYGGNMDITFMTSKRYEIPSVFKKIARDDKDTRIIKASTGLDLTELKGYDLIGQEPHQILMQWGMEAFSNPEIVNNSIKYIEDNEMFKNSDLYAFKDFNFKILKRLNLIPTISKLINPQSNGVAIQRANQYLYKTPYYSIYTAQAYHPGFYGDQQHIAGVTLSNDLSVFNAHPAVDEGDRGPNGNSPKYWVGQGHFPHTVQHENVNLSIYRTPKKKGMMEAKLLDYTHGYFPEIQFDESSIEGNLAFGKLGDAYIAFITTNDLSYKKYEEITRDWQGENYDLIQPGKEVYWITEASDVTVDGSFSTFKSRIKEQAKTITYDGKKISYTSMGRELNLEFKGDFKVNGEVMDLNYDRFDSPYIQANRTPTEMTFKLGDKELYLNFKKMIREYN
ncbi:MAG: hypothetical protein OCD02_05810 [Spirochaetaceae bacterium]